MSPIRVATEMISNCAPATRTPQINFFTFDGSGFFSIKGRGFPSLLYTPEAWTTLEPDSWTTVSVDLVNNSGAFELTDVDTLTLPFRFYRVRSPLQ
jgi:hypothetical protein